MEPYSEDSVLALTEKVFKISGYRFRDHELLKTAVTHPSIAAERYASYERLEFLGDAVLGLVVSEMLYTLFPDDSEGLLTKKRIALVRGSKVVEIAQSLNLGNILLMSKGELTSGGISNNSNLENALEALIGAIYVDGGLDSARHFILQHWKPLATNLADTPLQDAKTALQEWAQGHNFAIPSYRLINKSGLEHAPVFTVEVTVNGQRVHATGCKKKYAEIAAAKLMLEKVTKQNDP
ncbi:ribonuclease III [Anaplasma phagocytophilum]|nr:ribonuclease III [Anaplasma phagocytophilum]